MRLVRKQNRRKRRELVPCNCLSGLTDKDGNVIHYEDCALIRSLIGFDFS